MEDPQDVVPAGRSEATDTGDFERLNRNTAFPRQTGSQLSDKKIKLRITGGGLGSRDEPIEHAFGGDAFHDCYAPTEADLSWR